MFRVCVRYVSLDPYHNHNTGTVPVWSINMYFGVGSVCALIIPKKNKALLYAIRSPQTQKYTYLLFWLLSWSEILLNKNYSKYSNLPIILLAVKPNWCMYTVYIKTFLLKLIQEPEKYIIFHFRRQKIGSQDQKAESELMGNLLVIVIERSTMRHSNDFRIRC